MIEFATKIARFTFENKLEWETTADENALLAPLGGPYTVRLEHATRLNDDDREYQTIELTLLKRSDELFSVDSRMLDDTDFARRARITSSAWSTMREIWGRAILKAKKVTDELNAVNKLLTTKFGQISVATPDDDDDEVPF